MQWQKTTVVFFSGVGTIEEQKFDETGLGRAWDTFGNLWKVGRRFFLQIVASPMQSVVSVYVAMVWIMPPIYDFLEPRQIRGRVSFDVLPNQARDSITIFLEQTGVRV